jgi:hypothetical protein
MGKYIIDRFIRQLYKNEELIDKYKLSEFKENLLQKDEFKILDTDQDEILSYIGLQILNIMCEVKLIKSTLVRFGKKDRYYILYLSEKMSKLLNNNKIINKPVNLSLNLPMIVKPKNYVCNNRLEIESGGYYLNNELFIQPIVNTNPEQPNKPQISYNMVSPPPSLSERGGGLIDNLNSMMETPFKINTHLLDYLQDNHELFLKMRIIY